MGPNKEETQVKEEVKKPQKKKASKKVVVPSKQECNDKKCPFHGKVKLRGRVFEGTVVKVIDMGIRTTVVRTWKDEELIMPNSIFSQSTVKNYTLRDNQFRLGVIVGVSYDSDMNKVFAVLEKTARSVPWRLPDIEPRVMLQDFGNSSVDFGVYVSIDEPWRQRVLMAELRKLIWFAFKEANITIAYPQLDVHLDPPVTEAITHLRKAV